MSLIDPFNIITEFVDIIDNNIIKNNVSSTKLILLLYVPVLLVCSYFIKFLFYPIYDHLLLKFYLSFVIIKIPLILKYFILTLFSFIVLILIFVLYGKKVIKQDNNKEKLDNEQISKLRNEFLKISLQSTQTENIEEKFYIFTRKLPGNLLLTLSKNKKSKISYFKISLIIFITSIVMYSIETFYAQYKDTIIILSFLIPIIIVLYLFENENIHLYVNENKKILLLLFSQLLNREKIIRTYKFSIIVDTDRLCKILEKIIVTKEIILLDYPDKKYEVKSKKDLHKFCNKIRREQRSKKRNKLKIHNITVFIYNRDTDDITSIVPVSIMNIVSQPLKQEITHSIIQHSGIIRNGYEFIFIINELSILNEPILKELQYSIL